MQLKTKKTLKIITGVITFLTLPSLLFFGFIYFKYNENLPTGIKGEEADALAHQMLEALNYEAFKETDYIEWSFKNKHLYKWDKYNHICTVMWGDFKVDLHLKYPERSQAAVHSFKVVGKKRDELVQTATDYFNNDSFWLVAPYKVFDEGVERFLVKLDNGKKGLLVTYTTGGSTPGDSYLWEFDDTGKPKSFKMWTSILPIDGLEASWTDWVTTESGAQLPTFHKLLFLGLEINHIKGEKRPYLNSKN
jgi:hypothetical protein